MRRTIIGPGRRRLLLALWLLAIGLIAGVIRWQTSVTPQGNLQAIMPGIGGPERPIADADADAKYVADPGQASGLSGESAELHGIEDYWHQRVSYPTGRFDGQWLLQAAQQDRAIQDQVPGGRITYSTERSQSPLALDPNSWTALGPKPLQSNGCLNCFSYGHVAGRVNDIAIDPVDPTVAYIVTVGGGVWKTTNCCTPATTFTPVTDDPLITVTSVDDISIDPSNHNTIYVGTGDLNFGSFAMGSVGVYKSTDAGATWSIKGANVFTPYYPQPPGVFPQYQAIGKVEADPNNANRLVVGTKTGVYLSYDGGDNWSGPCFTNAFNTQRQDITGLILSANGAATDLYVAVGARGYSTTVQVNLAENGANGIYKTTVPASGCPATWSLISQPTNGWPAGTGSGIPQYQAGGNTLGRIDMDIAPSNSNYLYAIVQAINPTGNRGGVLGVWRTTDAGVTWAQQAGIGTNAAEWMGCARTGTQNWYNQGIEVDPTNPDALFVDTIDIFKSTNGADTFTNVTCGYNGGNVVHVDHHALEYVPGSASVMLAGSDGGMYVTSNAGSTPPTFSQLNDSLNTIEFYSGDITANFATSASPGINAGAQDNGSAVQVWAGNPVANMWQLQKGGDGMYARIEPVLGLRWYQESQNGNLAVSQTGPYGPQVNATGGWGADSPRVSFVFPYEIYKYDCPPTGCTHMIAGSYRVWETIQGAIPTSSWLANSPDLTKNTLADRSFVNQLSYAVSMSTTAVVGTNDGNFWYGFGLGQGVANSATWVNVTGSNAVLPNRPILDVTTDPVNPLVGYAAIGGFNENTPSTPGHVFQVTCTANCGSFVWADKTGNLPNIPVDSILANPNYPAQVFLGTDWGFYYTNDITVASPTWLRFSAGLPNVMIWDMAIDRGFTALALFTRGRGAYAWPLPSGPIPTTPSPTPNASVSPTPTSPPVSTPTATSGATNTPPPAGTATSTAVPPSPTVTPCTIQFTDVDQNNPFYTFIRCLACRQIVSGYSDGTFRWGNDVTRGQLSKIIAGAASLGNAIPSSQQTFSDVPNSNTFWLFIERLSGIGAISGYACGGAGEPCDPSNRPYFRWGNNATRGQISKITAVTAGWNGPIPTTQQTFTDVPPNNPFWIWIEELASRQIISGYACGGPGEPCDPQNRAYFRWGANATRGQMSKIAASAFFPNCQTPARP